MLDWLTKNVGTLAVAVVLAAIVAGIVLKMIKDRKQGKSSCGCNCAHCAMAGRCHGNAGEKALQTKA